MTKYTDTTQLIDTNPTMSISSASSTFLVKDFKLGQAKSATKSNKEEKVPVVPTMVLVKNNNDNEEGWNDIIKGNQKANHLEIEHEPLSLQSMNRSSLHPAMVTS